MSFVLVGCEAVDGVVQVLEAGGPAANPVRLFVGCTAVEIQEVADAQGLRRLPRVYECFLARMGKEAGGFLARGDGSEYLYPDLLTMREIADQILDQNGRPFTLDRSDVVIGQYLAQQFHFLDGRKGDPDDPPVWSYLESYVAPVQLIDRYSDLLLGLATEFTTGVPAFHGDYFADVPKLEGWK
ncbi:MAG TPA: hypothetical protein VKQ30_20110 [Ktedonobacterales bacterium]|nr:hypothetical protein [Ktedonobacterales bacterium]